MSAVSAYVELTAPPPRIFTSDHFKSWDMAMQQLAIANSILSRCEDCGMPVAEQRKECDALCAYFTSLNSKFRGPQSESPEVFHS